jgi:hypothetical protein
MTFNEWLNETGVDGYNLSLGDAFRAGIVSRDMEVANLLEQIKLLRECITDAIDMTHVETLRNRWCEVILSTESKITKEL